MPFCSRCFGCSIGHISAFILFLAGLLPAFSIAILLIIPLAIDWVIQEYFGIMSTNYRRLVTGILAGFGVGIIIIRTVLFLISEII